MSDDLVKRAQFVVQLFRECDAIQLPHGPTEQVLTGMIDHITALTAERDALAEENERLRSAVECARAVCDTPIARRRLNLDAQDERLSVLRAAYRATEGRT